MLQVSNLFHVAPRCLTLHTNMSVCFRRISSETRVANLIAKRYGDQYFVFVMDMRPGPNDPVAWGHGAQGSMGPWCPRNQGPHSAQKAMVPKGQKAPRGYGAQRNPGAMDFMSRNGGDEVLGTRADQWAIPVFPLSGANGGI